MEAAAAWAVAHGARRLVLHGLSMGAMIAGTFLRRSALAYRVAGLVLDAPALDRTPIIANTARSRHLPARLAPVIVRAAGQRTGVDVPALSLLAGEPVFDRPTLVFHGLHDPTVQTATSRALVRRHPDSVQLELIADAGHEDSWNVDPERYERRLQQHLTDTVVL